MAGEEAMAKMMTFTMAAMAWFGGHTLIAADRVQVYYRTGSGAIVDGTVLSTARDEASHLLAEAGVTLVWRRGAPAEDVAGPDTVVITFVDGVPADIRHVVNANALAAAKPYGPSSEISVFTDRVTLYYHPFSENGRGRVLGHVLAHEIVHVLEGVVRHSDSGLMIGNWKWRELRAITTGGLHLAEEDRRLVSFGIEARHRRAMLTAAASAR
jgi:hypothetical protein